MHTPTDEEAVRARADLITALVFVGLGIAIAYMSWTMDRLEVRRIQPATIPGLVPFFLGVFLTLCGGLLAWRSYRLSRPGSGASLLGLLVSWAAVRVYIVAVLAFVYTLGLVGRMPFWLASCLFIFSFIMLFETVFADEKQPLLRSLFWAVVVALVGGLGIFFVFERIFLVRLP